MRLAVHSRIPFVAAFLGLSVLATATRGASEVGDKAVLSFTAVDGTPVSIEKLKGRIVVIDFWASWCPPCMAFADEMVAINKQYHPKGLQIVGISLDEDKAVMQKVAKEKGFAWPHYFDGKKWDTPLVDQFAVHAIPFTLVVGPDGTILWKGRAGDELKKAIDKAFKEHPPKLVDEQTLSKSKSQLDEVEQKNKSGQTAPALKLLAKVPEEAKADKDTAARMNALATAAAGSSATGATPRS